MGKSFYLIGKYFEPPLGRDKFDSILSKYDKLVTEYLIPYSTKVSYKYGNLLISEISKIDVIFEK